MNKKRDKNYQQNLEETSDLTGRSLYTELLELTGKIKEVPTRAGIALTGFYLFTIVTLLTLAFFVFAYFLVPKYDRIIDARLGDDYVRQFSAPLKDSLDMPEAMDRLEQTLAVDMDQDDGHIYLATYGHGIQVYNKDNYLWKTYDAEETGGEIKNDNREVHYREIRGEDRLWTLSSEGGISIGDINGNDIELSSLYAKDSWLYFTEEEISATLLFKDNSFLAVGTASKGGAVYSTLNHTWFDLPELREREIREIIFKENLLWFLTEHGVTVYGFNEDEKDARFEHIAEYDLKEDSLTDLRVFSRERAIALTDDRGCYLFENRWTNKLLGGIAIPQLTQENIKYAAYLSGQLVVLGEKFGIAAYNPEKRNWLPLLPGKMPHFRDFDYSKDALVLATDDGIYITKGSTANHYMKGQRINRISLKENKILYLTADESSAMQEIGWINIDGSDHTVVMRNNTLPIEKQPKINDVIENDGSFWLATESDGVIKYTVNGRNLHQLNETTNGTILNARKIRVMNNKIYLLADRGIYILQSSSGSMKWVLNMTDVLDFRQDPVTKDLWIKNKNGSLSHVINRTPKEKDSDNNSTEDIWFSGQGPTDLDLSSADAFVSSPSPGRFEAYFPVQAENKMYVYNSARGSWSPPRELPGHNFSMFTMQNGNMFTLDSNSRVFSDKNVLLGEGKPDLKLSDILRASQTGGSGSNISLFGSRSNSVYQPAKGRWVNNKKYPFLIGDERLTKIYRSDWSAEGQLVKTSNGRLLLLKEGWQAADIIGSTIYGEHFDGSTFWRVSGNSLKGQTIERDGESISVKNSEYFSGAAPDLSNILEAWFSSEEGQTRRLNLVTPKYWSVYDPETHSWTNEVFEHRPVIRADYSASRLQAVTKNKIVYMNKPGQVSSFVNLPSGKLKKIDQKSDDTVITVQSNNANKAYYRNGKEWVRLDSKRQNFKGDFNNITKVFQTDSKLWVFQPPNILGGYVNGKWKTYRISSDFRLSHFWKSPKNLLFLVGHFSGTTTNIPVYYYNGSGFSMLSPGLNNVSEVRKGPNISGSSLVTAISLFMTLRTRGRWA